MIVAHEAPKDDVEHRIRAIRRLHRRLHSNPVLGVFTKAVVSVVGFAVVAVGIVLSGPGVPGPGLLVIIFGLAILATEWDWAERLLRRARAMLAEARRRAVEMDPAVRRRRIALAAGACALAAGGVLAYLWFFDWPEIAVAGWDRVQSLHDAVPELPGM